MRYKKIGWKLIESVPMGLAMFAALCVPFNAIANPLGGVVVGGNATITEAGKNLTVDQQSNLAVIDWQNFDIQADEATRFNQPNANAIALNRVKVGANASQILGKLSANGKLMIVNPNGVVFGQGSQVDVNGLFATTADIATNKFMNGQFEFDQPGNPNAKIINHGTISAKDAGLVGLVAPEVENHGTITAKLGKVRLSSGDRATVDMYGDDIMAVTVSDDVTKQLVSNTGTIEAASIELSSAAGKNIVESLINVQGELKAVTATEEGGTIRIFAEGSNAVIDNVEAEKGKKTGESKVEVAAKIEASSTTSKGGKIQILGDRIVIKASTTINASGKTGGGKIHIGGEYQGYGKTPTSLSTVVEKNAQLKADAIESGNGGEIINWSDGYTGFAGHASARGGALSGNGGLIEVSGLKHLDFVGSVNLLAPNGSKGMLLLDPTNITISNAADAAVTGASPYSPNADNATSNLNINTLLTALGGGAVTVQTRASGAQAGNLTIVDVLNAPAGSLTLIAHNDIIINAATTLSSLSMDAAHDIIVNAATSATVFTAQATNDIIFNAGLTSFVGTFRANRNIDFNTAMNVHSAYILPRTLTNSMGLAGAAGTVQVSAASLANIAGTNVREFGRDAVLTTMTGVLSVGTMDWTSIGMALRYYSTNGINFTGAQTFANFTSVIMASNRTISIAGSFSGGDNLTITPLASNTRIDLAVGTGPTNLNMSAASLSNISGFLLTTIGSATNNAITAINDAITWNNSIEILNTTSAITVSGVQNIGSNSFTLRNSGTAGGITFNSGADIMGSGDVTLVTNRALTIGSAFTGSTGYLSIYPGTGSTVINTNNAGGAYMSLTTASMANLGSNWAGITFGSGAQTGNINLGAANTFNTNVSLYLGTGVTITGAQNFGSKNFTVTTGTGGITINNGADLITSGAVSLGTTRAISIASALTGTGSIEFRSMGTTMTVGTSAGGNFSITAANIANLGAGWGSVLFNASNNILNITAANTWQSNVTFRGGSTANAITVTGAQNAGTKSFAIEAGGAITFNAGADIITSGAVNLTATRALTLGSTLTGTGALTINTNNTGAQLNVNPGAGFTMTATSITRLGSGWSGVHINSGTADMSIMGANTWTTPLTLSSNQLQFWGTQAMGTKALTINTTSNIGFSSGLTGSGAVTFNSTGNVEMIFMGGTMAGTGTLTFNSLNSDINLNTYAPTGGLRIGSADPTYLGSGWSSVTFNSGSGAINIHDASPWGVNTILNSSGIVTINGAQDMGTKSLTITGNNGITFNSGANITGSGAVTLNTTRELSIGSLLTGTGALSVNSSGNMIDINSSPNGAVNLSGTSVANLGSGWSGISFDAGAGMVRVYGNNTWGSNLTLAGSDVRFMGGTQTMQGSLAVNATDVTLNTGTNIISNYNTADGNGNKNGIWMKVLDDFINNAGANVFTMNNGSRWLVHMNSLADNFRDGLLPDASEFSRNITTTTPTDISGAGNRFLYHNNQATAAGTLTLSFDNFTRTYGGATNPSAYTITGFKGADTQANATDGAANISGFGITSASNVGTYTDAVRGDWGTIDDAGSVATKLGYTFDTSFGNANYGNYIINPATLTITANNKTKTYGAADPTLDYGIAGLVAGDTAAIMTGAQTRVAGETVAGGPYAISQGTLSAGSNYTINYTGANLTINPAQLTVSAVAKSKTQGDGDPILNYIYNGLTNGDTTTSFSGALARAAGEGAGSYLITLGTLASANSNYTIGTFNTAMLNISALSSPPPSPPPTSDIPDSVLIVQQEVVRNLYHSSPAWGDLRPQETVVAVNLLNDIHARQEGYYYDDQLLLWMSKSDMLELAPYIDNYKNFY